MTTIPMISHKIKEFPFIEIYPICDLHVGSKEFQEAEFQKTSRYIMAEPNRFVVLAGDIVDNGVKSSVTSPYEALMQPREQRIYAAELLYPLVSRVLCVVPGNHCYRSIKDVDADPMEIIASKLNIEHLYRPDIAFLKLDVGERTDHTKRPPRYCVAVTHGAGNGSLLGAGLSKSESFALSLGVDLMITGHSHRPSTAPTTRLECDMGKGVMVSREVRIMIATGWLSYGGYPARKMLKPLPIRPNHAILNGREFDISVVS